MKYFGVPTCPYCKKRVNLVRTWSLKRQGEYCCPRCSGISNIYLSPLVYVFALLAVFSAGAVYFFHKFVLDDISFSIVVQVMIPFVAFFLLSLFLVYLEKPVIKKVPKSEMTKRQRKEQQREQRNMVPPVQPIDHGDYLPRGEYTAANLPEPPTKIAEHPSPVPRAVPSGSELEKTAVVPHVRPQQPAPQPERTPVRRPAQTRLPRPVSPTADPRAQSLQKPVAAEPKKPAVTSSSTDDFFAKYDDPEYVQRRLRELGEKDD